MVNTVLKAQNGKIISVKAVKKHFVRLKHVVSVKSVLNVAKASLNAQRIGV